MEVLDLIALLSVLGTVSGTIVYLIIRKFPQKTVKKVAEDNITRLLKANTELTEQYEERQKQMYKTLQQENIRMRKELNPTDEEGQPQKENVTLEQVMPLLQQSGIDPMLISGLSLFKKDVDKFLKGKSPEEIAQLAKTVQGVLANRQNKPASQGSDSSLSEFA